MTSLIKGETPFSLVINAVKAFAFNQQLKANRVDKHCSCNFGTPQCVNITSVRHPPLKLGTPVFGSLNTLKFVTVHSEFVILSTITTSVK